MQNFINSFFAKEKTQCPRCLGKGFVDANDIKRLQQELHWLPGKCAYCNGKGKVNTQQIDTIKVDQTYLTSDLPQEEIKKLLKNDAEANARGKQLEQNRTHFIQQIEFLHFKSKMNATMITEFYLISQNLTEVEKQQLLDYVTKVIEVSDYNRSF